MKRRKLLKQLGFGLSGGLLLPHLLTSCSKDDPGPEVPYDGDVVVIGAGAAGMYTADILKAKGIKVTVLEAGNQIGGRVRSLRNQKDLVNLSVADFPVELGAEVIYGSDSIWGTNLKNFAVNTIDIDEASSDRYLIDNIAKLAEEWDIDGDFVNAQNFVESLKNFSGSGVTVEQAAAGLPARVKALINSQVGNLYGSSNANVGMAGLSEALQARDHDGARLALKTNPMQDFLIFRFDQVRDLVQLNTQVTSIDSTGDKVLITDANGNQIETNKVVVTVPLSILKQNVISFSPGLPGAMTSAMGRIGMDHSIRVVIDFKKNFWGETTGWLWGGESIPNCFSAGVGRSEFNQTLSITINGPKAVELSAQGPDMVNTILAELDVIYNGQATAFVRRDFDTSGVLSIIQDWGKDEFIRGGYSYPMASATLEDRKNLGIPIGDKIFFAGEATDVSGDAGTINGALASAERVAEEIVKSITGE
ncbi:MAG TPA: NAD(P)/FAD-dependent oxidoreductase [Cyclobacteriaceae bacterium]|nr:NAD(P)/FAD-dependent oxidoreductase [Cyclobacteriaceae bacterium]